MSGGKCGGEMCFRHAERLSENSVGLLFEDTSVVVTVFSCVFACFCHFTPNFAAFTDFGSS